MKKQGFSSTSSKIMDLDKFLAIFWGADAPPKFMEIFAARCSTAPGTHCGAGSCVGGSGRRSAQAMGILIDFDQESMG